jgi:hypothetical protein
VASAVSQQTDNLTRYLPAKMERDIMDVESRQLGVWAYPAAAIAALRQDCAAVGVASQIWPTSAELASA